MKKNKQQRIMKKITKELLALSPEELETSLKEACDKARKEHFCWAATIAYGIDPDYKPEGECKECSIWNTEIEED